MIRQPAAFAMLAMLVACAPLRARADEPAPAPVAAADIAREAREWFARGIELSRAERWQDAREAFVRSAELTPRASTFFNLAVASVELGLGRATLDALAQFDALNDSAEHRRYDATATELRARATALTGRVLLALTPATAEVLVDGSLEQGAGSERELVLDRGAHALTVRAPGHVQQLLELEVAAGEVSNRRVDLEVQPAELSVARAPAQPSAAPAVAAIAPLSGLLPPAQPPHAPRPSILPAGSAGPKAEASSFWQEPLLWTIVGIVLVGAGTATAIALADDPPYGGSIGEPF